MNLLDYVNPMYWKREYLVGAVLGSQVPPAAAVVLELYAEDAKRFFYYQSSVVQVVVAPPLSEQLAAKGLGRAEVEKAEKEMTEAAGRAKKSVLMKPLDGTPSNSVDAVVCVQAARRVAEAGRLSDLARVLKPGGRVVFLEEPEDLAVLDAVGDQFEAVELLDEQDGLAVGYALMNVAREYTPETAGFATSSVVFIVAQSAIIVYWAASTTTGATGDATSATSVAVVATPTSATTVGSVSAPVAFQCGKADFILPRGDSNNVIWAGHEIPRHILKDCEHRNVAYRIEAACGSYTPLFKTLEDSTMLKISEPNVDHSCRGPVLNVGGMKMHVSKGFTDMFDKYHKPCLILNLRKPNSVASALKENFPAVAG